MTPPFELTPLRNLGPGFYWDSESDHILSFLVITLTAITATQAVCTSFEVMVILGRHVYHFNCVFPALPRFTLPQAGAFTLAFHTQTTQAHVLA
jgi:hypothetical protein